jgi:hypothetical protein
MAESYGKHSRLRGFVKTALAPNALEGRFEEDRDGRKETLAIDRVARFPNDDKPLGLVGIGLLGHVSEGILAVGEG